MSGAPEMPGPSSSSMEPAQSGVGFAPSPVRYVPRASTVRKGYLRSGLWGIKKGRPGEPLAGGQSAPGVDRHRPEQASTLEVSDCWCLLVRKKVVPEIYVYVRVSLFGLGARMGKLSPAFLYVNCMPSPHPHPYECVEIPAPNPGQLYLPLPLPAPPSLNLFRSLCLSLSLHFSLLVCTCVSTARAGEEPAAAFNPSRPAIKH